LTDLTWVWEGVAGGAGGGRRRRLGGAGIRVCLLTGFAPATRDELTRAKAPAILDSVAELPSLLGLG
jgi:hypothetical protein